MTSFALISDTHGKHGDIYIPKVDYLIHAGDFSNLGNEKELDSFNGWVRKLKEGGTIKGAIVCAGNHELSLEVRPKQARKHLPDIDHLLTHEGIEIDGLKIWGCSYTPVFYNWAFMRSEDDLYWIYNQIPVNLDILICHGPPRGFCDWNGREHVGSHALAEILAIKAPKVLICGHIHDSRGVDQLKNTIIINASSADPNYNMLPAMVLNL